MLLSWIITAVLFGVFHLSTYNWNIYQAVIGIGIICLILTYPYIKTKNLWVSVIVHIANDWIIFLPIVISNWK
ncbi:CPBP family glutamic-type intramembrane protease [Lacrimispora sp.]|uniref:CPBP family glutamic-type intramembrane protease n=1 Tax=Lacrimispora sp. TaxID=2719234 RepID=UPI00345F7F79